MYLCMHIHTYQTVRRAGRSGPRGSEDPQSGGLLV